MRLSALVAGAATAVAFTLCCLPASAAVVAPPSIDPALEKLQLRVVKDRDRAKRGRLKLGALSDGYFEVEINAAKGRVDIAMPPLRAKRLMPTRRLVAKRYAGLPVRLRLARRTRPQTVRDPKTAPRPGKPFVCRGDTVAIGLPGRAAGSSIRAEKERWNGKEIVGKPLAKAKRLARRHGCVVREALVDGMELATTRDYVPFRMNVAIRAGRVTHILGLG